MLRCLLFTYLLLSLFVVSGTFAQNSTPANTASIEGMLLMLDGETPHVAVHVQAVRGGEVMANTLSDGQGKYRFENLEPGEYRIRCYTLNGYVYYRERKAKKREGQLGNGDIVRVDSGGSLEGIDFRFAPFKKGTWRTYTQFSGLVHNRVREIHRAPDGIFWFGTANGGISRYDGKRFVNFTPEDGLAHNQIWEMHQDPDGVMWFGTEAGGVSRYDGKEFINFTTEDGLAGNWVAAIHCDPDGVMWFGTEGGLSRYDGKEFINFTTEDGLADNFVTSIHRDPDGVMWLGTRLGGISRYDGGEFLNLNTEDGLASN